MCKRMLKKVKIMEEEDRRQRSRRVLIIGVDGATFEIIKPMMEKGMLETFKRLIENGVHGVLKSTIPPASIPAWQSFMTGKNPGKHGIFDFMTRVDNDYHGRLVTSRDLKAKTLWKMTSLEGKRCIVIGMTGTYPPEKIKGVLIAGMMAPEGAIYTHPPELTEMLNRTGYVKFVSPSEVKDDDELYKRVLEMERTRTKVATMFMREQEWDLFVVMLIGTDTVQHELWAYRDLLESFYREIDAMISQFVENAGDDVDIFIVSDHGFGEFRKYFYVNVWLHQIGLLKYRKVNMDEEGSVKLKRARGKDVSFLYRVFYKLGLTQQNILKILKTLRIDWIRKYLPENIKKKAYSLPQTNLEIDWENSKAFLSSFFGTETQSITINLKGREPKGTVSPEEYEALREYIIRKLKEITDPETGEPIVEEVYRGEELYSGPYADNAPDIIMRLRDGYKTSGSLTPEEVVGSVEKIFGRVKGSHRQYGIFIAYGPDIKRGVEVRGAEIVDIAPTAMHLLGLPIPEDVDGKVLKEIFAEGSEAAEREPKFVPPEYYDRKEEMERIRERAKRIRKKMG